MAAPSGMMWGDSNVKTCTTANKQTTILVTHGETYGRIRNGEKVNDRTMGGRRNLWEYMKRNNQTHVRV